jgi:uncharacterized membrane protein
MNDHMEKNVKDGGAKPAAAGFYPTLDRFSAFSDGVFAIAITLLVLELPVPPENVPLLPALLAAWHDFLGYIMSFAIIGGIWLTHSGLTRLMKRGDRVANGVNLLLLLFVAILPFTTSVLVTHLSTPDIGPAVLLYGLNVLLASLTLSLLIGYIAHEPSLVADDIADETLRWIIRQRWISIGVNSIAIAVALIAPQIAVGLYLIQTMLTLVFPLVGMRRRPARNQQGDHH